MTSIFTNYVAKRFLGESLQNNFGQEDPYFERVPATRLNGRPSKKGKKRRKALPPGISEHDGKVLTKVKRRAYFLDMSLCNCCGIRFGWSSVIGIIPGLGDVCDAMMAIMVMRTCDQIEGGLPQDVKIRMYGNILMDFGIGILPLLGDLLDALFRANTKNAVLLEKHLRQKGAKALRAQGQALPATDPTDPDEYDQQLREENGPPPPYTSSSAQHGTYEQGQSQSQSTHPQTSESRGGGWFSGFGSKKKQPDVERGNELRTVERPGRSTPARPSEAHESSGRS
ncbi:hypothetical protein OIDMADRAFT_17785 [Oidiodendron maius Zn]|uniref:PH domain-containing protein n=1 Tax=Oidiodendron maius (strain Zn) TaxID=913774 RepID=A0A0C3DSB2_OIDMZ|nr:hypothetical protein OIDMADRAFT_17785 [Oidiodendron maius Zn]